MKKNLLLIGCGKMGSALLEGWVSDNNNLNIIVVDPVVIPQKDNLNKGIKYINNIESIQKSFIPHIIVLAVKPQAAKKVLEKFKNQSYSDALVLSIIAGLKLDSILNFFGKPQPIIRAMPNTPASVKMGITALCANDFCKEKESQLAKQLLQVVGEVFFVEEEKMIDMVTAISGSGPAYFFYFVECLAEAGISIGLSNDLSWKLAVETFLGSAELCNVSLESPKELRKNVTSPGGTTEAALSTFMKNESLKKIIINAVNKAKLRSVELSKII
ncbi:pyrroline-5-carboxylate reductase [Alphaproteobacteria bacterium]|nr:pyrroline-5-carboxylate reductase [Alphaproteobacteria bacterium]